LEFAPGVKDIIDSYNSSMKGLASYSKEKTAALSKNITHLGRWITDVMYHNEVLNKHDWNV
jgi:hypothetical protein